MLLPATACANLQHHRETEAPITHVPVTGRGSIGDKAGEPETLGRDRHDNRWPIHQGFGIWNFDPGSHSPLAQVNDMS